MSRIGRKPVQTPKGAKVSLSGRVVTVEGPKGTLTFEHAPRVRVEELDGGKAVAVSIDEADAHLKPVKALWGTTRALINNMMVGVTQGYEKKLEIVGVGWSAEVSGQKLSLKIGYANRIEVPIPSGVSVEVEKQQSIRVSGADKQAVGEFAAKVRAKRKPEPYNGKGIKYADEVIMKKEGKTGA